jgi:hypothetical protein
VVVDFEGGEKGLLVNSTDLCKGRHRATVNFTGHSGKVHDFKPLLQASAAKAAKKAKGTTTAACAAPTTRCPTWWRT